MIFYDIQRLLSVFLIELNGQVRSDTMRCQKCHHITSSPIRKIGITYLFQVVGSNAGNSK